MSTIVTRAGKGSALTHNEVDANFTNLNTDKVEKTGTDPVVISVNSSSDALRITQTGTGNALVVEDSTNPDSTPFVVDTTGRVITGATQAYANYLDGFGGTARSPIVQINGTSLSLASSSLTNWANADSPPLLVLAKSKSGTVGTMTSTFSVGDVAGAIQFSASDNTNFVPTALIEALIDGTTGTGDMPGCLVFSTTADGASLPTERMRIDSSGNVGIGTASPQELLELSASNNGITAGTAPNNTLRFNDADISTASGQPIGRLEFYGNDTGNENVVAYIDARAGGSSGGGFFVFGTSASAGGAATDAFTMSVTGGIEISRTAVTSPVSNDGNVFSGTYTPSLTNTTNITASTPYQFQYTRIGNVVTVSGRVNIDPTASATASELGISLPIASAFPASATGVSNLAGVGSIHTTTTEVSTGGILADTTNDRAQFRFVSGGTAARDYAISFTYLVV